MQGSKLEIPLWLAKGLHDSKRRIVSVELPKIYKEAWRTVFSADANVVDLHKMGPYYYGFGSQLLNFDNPENPEIAQTILQASIWTKSWNSFLRFSIFLLFPAVQQSSGKISCFNPDDFWIEYGFLDQAVGWPFWQLHSLGVEASSMHWECNFSLELPHCKYGIS